MTATHLAHCDHVSRRFDVRGATVWALDEVSLDVQVGKLTAIAGPSGSGKSTLLAMLGCLDRPTAGSVRMGEFELSILKRAARRRLRRTTVATVLPQPTDNVMVGRTGIVNLHVAAKQRSAPTSSIDEVIEAIGIGDFVHRVAGTMSGGEQQRLALGCAMVGGTPLVLADEPTGALDDASAIQVVEALTQAAACGATIVVATHDAKLIERSDHVAWLDHGRRTS